MTRILFFLMGLSLFFAACNNAATTEKEEGSTETKKEEAADPNLLKLKFVNLTFADAPHYFFEDEKGKSWEFGKVEGGKFNFVVELPEKEANSDNQGWGPNKDLIGKWFNIKHETKKMQLYQDGPEGDVVVITSIEEAK
jgi:hypothetical protein